MNFADYDQAVRNAQDREQRAQRLFADHRTKVEKLSLQLHHAPRLNEELAEQIAQAAVDDLPAPDGTMIDINSLKRQAEILAGQTAIFQNALEDATTARAKAERDRYDFYLAWWRAYARTKVPEQKTLRQPRPGLPDFFGTTLADIFSAYVLDHAGQSSADPRAFGEYVGRLFALPRPGDIWPELRAEANAWAADQEQKKGAAA